MLCGNKYSVLIFWPDLLELRVQQRIVVLDPRAVFWPASYSLRSSINSIPVEWWISFSSDRSGLIWLVEYGDQGRIVSYK